MVHIGNQTSWATTPTEPFDYALAQGFDAFEWFPDKKPEGGWDDSDLDRPTRQRIAETARARGVHLSVHARWQANLLTRDGLELFWKDFDLARDLGATLINIHLAHEPGLPAFITAILPLIRRTAEAGLQLSIENTPHHAPELLNELFARLRQLDSVKTAHVGMCLDLGHANLCAATRNDYLGFYDRLDPNLPLIHLHLHENWGDSDSHLPLFTGPSARDDSGIRGFVARLKKRDYSGSIILEQWPHPPSLLNNARDRLLQLWQPRTPPPPSDGEVSSAQRSAPQAPVEPDLIVELVDGDRARRSWREKLDFARELLARDNPAVTSDQLVDIAIYLRFLGTGEIACAEDGRHFRPGQHARLASQIQDRLARLTTPDNHFIVRRIYPWLPSSAPTFQRPEPLTRIRDIAHRNDIPQDLKREIKTTLQNKLHRCAGPEDLVTSGALLERITAPGASYSPGFVQQFKIFHEELKEFFNAQSLEQRLTAVTPSLNGKGVELIKQFLKQKARAGVKSSGATPDVALLLATFSTLTALRRTCLDVVAQKPGAESEAVLLADIGLEDFAFVLLSEIINVCELVEASAAGECQLEALALALQNLILSGVDPSESSAVQNELNAWGSPSPSGHRNELLRQKATLSRCRRLAEDFGDRVVALFSTRATKLGRALGVAEDAIRVFSEADIRSHIVFQISKLATSLLRQIRHQLNSPPWDVLVPGNVAGRVTTIATLNTWEGDARGPIVALLQNAVGDEEIPASVAGILLAHELPHLSHLAVRARQARVVFVACDEATEFERLQSLKGQWIALKATPEEVTWEKVGPGESPKPPGRPTNRTVPPVRLTVERACISLEEATPEDSGGKSVGAHRLEELSRQPNAGFTTPAALAIPFGGMEQALRATPDIDAEYKEAIRRLDRTPSAQIDAAAARLRDLLQRLPVPDEIISQVRQKFRSPLMVRSSANCEDTEELAGAGLYESVPNVLPSNAGSAIRKVWASLWTTRATLSRREAGIPQDQAHMAVLIQEMLNPDFAFVLHTVDPITRDPRALYGELVVGMGETLVSAADAGDPYRFTCDKQSASVEILAFANFSNGYKAASPDEHEDLLHETLNYSRIALSRDPAALESLGRRLCKIGAFVEQALRQPQDIEGVVIQDKLYLVQTRPQQGL